MLKEQMIEKKAVQIVARFQHWMNTIRSKVEEWAEENNYNCWKSVLDERDVNAFVRDVKLKLQKGWSEEDIFRFFKNTEEVDPRIPEDIALKRMEAIRTNAVRK